MHVTTIAQRAAYTAATHGQYDEARRQWRIAGEWYLAQRGPRIQAYGQGCMRTADLTDDKLPRYQTL